MKNKDLIQALLQHDMHEDVYARMGSRRVDILQVMRFNDEGCPHTAIVLDIQGDPTSDLVIAIEETIRRWRAEGL